MINVKAIETQGLTKRYRSKLALEDLHLSVEEGEIFGFLGPNGAGKTTTIRLLLGLAYPTRGEVRIFGRSPQDVDVRRQVGYLPELFRFHEWMTGAELLRFHGNLYGLSSELLKTRIPEVLERVGLLGHEQRRIQSYSKGMQQRIGLAQAILHQPRLLLLDEPTSALDPLGRKEVRELLKRLREEGTTVLLNSHLLSEVEQTCDRIAILHRGRLLQQGRMDELGALEVEILARPLSPELTTSLSQLGHLVQEGERLILRLSSRERLPEIAQRVLAAGSQLYQLTPRAHLEDLFVQLIEEAS